MFSKAALQRQRLPSLQTACHAAPNLIPFGVAEIWFRKRIIDSESYFKNLPQKSPRSRNHRRAVFAGGCKIFSQRL